MQKKKISFIFGTRPELIKIAPVVRVCRATFSVNLISTGQHKELLDGLFHWFDIQPNINLDVMTNSQSPSKVVSNVLNELETILNDSDLVIVQGDTASAFAGAMASFLKKIPVAHLEAGLRTNTKCNPFPEEMFRRQITQIADVHFAPTQRAAQNIFREGFKNNVYVVGNTVIDSIQETIQRLKAIEQDNVKSLSKFVNLPFKSDLEGRKILFVTMHRRENLGTEHEQVALALKEIMEEYNNLSIVFPIHPNPIVRKSVEPILQNIPHVHLIEPIDYVTLAWILQESHILITDSGGLQEEGASIGKPTLILRETTERQEAVEDGVAKLIGTNKHRVKDELRILLDDDLSYKTMAKRSTAFGDGRSASKILEILQRFWMEEK